MAIFLTLGLIGVITGSADSAASLLLLFIAQFGWGTMAGLAVGRLATAAINRINLNVPGLQPLLAPAFGLAAVLGGSGFLAITVEIHPLRQVDGEIVDDTVQRGARVVGRPLRDLALPEGVLGALILRGKQVVMPRGPITLEPGDHVFVALRSSLQPGIDRLFDPGSGGDPDSPADISA
jgi:NhaP-type Na+/H+ and K+/H+ antiporter